ncbi:MAG: hypothetical protein V7K38_23790 [Nostoc sp.]
MIRGLMPLGVAQQSGVAFKINIEPVIRGFMPLGVAQSDRPLF